jgi:hypothetical protein
VGAYSYTHLLALGSWVIVGAYSYTHLLALGSVVVVGAYSYTRVLVLGSRFCGGCGPDTPAERLYGFSVPQLSVLSSAVPWFRGSRFSVLRSPPRLTIAPSAVTHMQSRHLPP